MRGISRVESVDTNMSKKTTQNSFFYRAFLRWTKKKVAVTILVIAVLVFGGSAVFRGLQSAADMAVPVATVNAVRQDIEDALSLRSVLEGNESVEVSSGFHAEVLSIHVQEGDSVSKGQLLATLDATSLMQSITREANDLKLRKLQLQETLKNRQREYEKALSVLETAQTQYERTLSMFEADAETLLNLTDAENLLADSRRVVDSFNVSDGKVVASAAESQEISNAEQALAVSRQKLDDTEIRSQIDGTVTRIYTRVGRFADETGNNQPMFVIEDIDNLQMRVMVNEQNIGRVRIGQEVEITADILDGDTVAGVVERISPTGELREGSVSERVIPVFIRVTEKQKRLISGITARAVIKIATVKDALTLPWETITERDDGSVEVYIVNDDNTVSIVPVTLGIENDLIVEIHSSEINEETPVIINPGSHLEEGMSVKPVNNQ